MKRPLRAVLVEDSPDKARSLVRALEAEGDIVVVATARTPDEAVEQIARLGPDVVTLDLDVPHGGAQLAIERIMADQPTPILVLSELLEGGSRHAVQALAAGAVDALPKPRTWTEKEAADLRRVVRRVGSVPVIRRRGRRPPAARRPRPTQPGADGAVVGIAASTGGPAAVARVLSELAGLPAPVLVVQHIHPSFADGYATWLESASGRPVCMAADGITAEAGLVYVAPGDVHLRLGPKRSLILDPEPPHLHRPSADVLFQSMAEQAGAAAVGVVLTGMGEDGARGLVSLRAAGGTVLAQDEESSAVFGMPRAAQRAGAAERFLALPDVASAVREAVDAVR
jgi:two-component system, chemotaxis family, protein-glutamate methylesterase/glutaminase